MHNFLICLLSTAAFILPTMAQSVCEGTDLIAALPQEQRAEIEAAANAKPFHSGLLWQAHKDETEITIFGTYHFSHEKTSSHLADLSLMILGSDRVYLEVSNEDSKRLQEDLVQDRSLVFITKGPTLPDLLGQDDWPRFSSAMRDRQIPNLLASQFKPVWAMMMLGIGPCEAQNGALDGHGIDKRIGELADSVDIPSRSLESYKQTLNMFDHLPIEEQLDILRLTLNAKDDPDDLAYTLRKHYLSQDIALIWEFGRWQAKEMGNEADFDEFEDYLLTQRNKNWVKDMLPDIDGLKVFMAVGAAHLPGQNGVLTLLQEQGYTIEAIPFSDTPE